MWRSKLFWRLFGGYGALLALSLTLLSWGLLSRMEQRLQAGVQEGLTRDVIALRETLRHRPAEQSTPAALQPLARDLARQMNVRVTFLTGEGKVLADSGTTSLPEVSLADRPEVRESTADKAGWHIRGGQAGEPEMLFVALRTDTPSGPMIVRLASTLDTVKEDMRWMRKLVWSGAALTLVPALLGSWWIARRQSGPIAKLATAAQAMACGEPAQRVPIQSSGELQALATAFNDMNDACMRHITQMEQDRQQLRAVFSSMLEGVAVIDHDQRIILLNEAASHVLRVPRDASIGRKLWELVRHRQLAEMVDRVLAGSGPQQCEIEWRFPADRILAVRVSALSSDAPRGAVLVLADITQLRRLERYRKEFVANASHEMKTPLAAIQAMVETLLDGAVHDPEHNVRFLKCISENVNRLSRLILDLLTLGRIEPGQETFNVESLPLEQAMAACQRRHEHAARAGGGALELLPPDVPIAVRADQEALVQILDNLVTNAITYTPAGGRVVLRWFADGETACLEVEDTGEGISERDLPRIFERFYRVDRARSRALGGTGLGLSIVKHLCQALGGSVTATSELGSGSTFTVRLPRAELPTLASAS